VTQSHMPEERDFACTVPQIRLTAHVKIRGIIYPSVCIVYVRADVFVVDLPGNCK